MLRLVVLTFAVLLGLSSAVPVDSGDQSSAGTPQSSHGSGGYGGYGGYRPPAPHGGYFSAPPPVRHSGRDLYSEVAETRSRIQVLGENDLLINSRLDGVMVKIEMVNNFRQEFENTIYPQLRASNQGLIDQLTAELRELSVLRDEVSALSALVDNLVQDLKDIRTVRVAVNSDLDTLRNEDIVQQQRITDLEAQIDAQDESIGEVSTDVSNNEALDQEVYGNLHRVVEVVNVERGESFEVDLSNSNPSAYVRFGRPYASAPAVSYSIVDLSVSEVPQQHSQPQGYGSGYQQPSYPTAERLSGQVTVVADANGVNVTLNDSSEQWVFDSVTVRVAPFLLDNSVLVYNGNH